MLNYFTIYTFQHVHDLHLYDLYCYLSILLRKLIIIYLIFYILRAITIYIIAFTECCMDNLYYNQINTVWLKYHDNVPISLQLYHQTTIYIHFHSCVVVVVYKYKLSKSLIFVLVTYSSTGIRLYVIINAINA